MIAPNTACGLNVLGARFRLTKDDHQTQPRDVQTNGNHVGRNRDVHMVLGVERQRQSPFVFRDLIGCDAAGQFDDVVFDLPALKETFDLADPFAAGIAGNAITDFILDQPSRPSKLPQTVEVAH